MLGSDFFKAQKFQKSNIDEGYDGTIGYNDMGGAKLPDALLGQSKLSICLGEFSTTTVWLKSKDFAPDRR